MSEYGPIELGEALREALRTGANPFEIKSGWIHVIFPTDCGGTPPDSDPEYVWDQNYYLLTMCDLSDAEIKQLMALYGVPNPGSSQ